MLRNDKDETLIEMENNVCKKLKQKERKEKQRIIRMSQKVGVVTEMYRGGWRLRLFLRVLFVVLFFSVASTSTTANRDRLWLGAEFFSFFFFFL